MKNIVLASASPRRAELLKLINLEFIVVPSYITETIDEKLSIEEVVQSLACQKATDVAKNLKAGELVIGVAAEAGGGGVAAGEREAIVPEGGALPGSRRVAGVAGLRESGGLVFRRRLMAAGAGGIERDEAATLVALGAGELGMFAGEREALAGMIENGG